MYAAHMDTSSAGFLLFNFFIIISTASSKPGFLQLGALLQGPSYETGVEYEKVTFLHFTRNRSGVKSDYNDVTKDFQKLDTNLPLVIILHGFMGSPHARSTKLLIEGYVNKGGSNVVGVNWKDLAKGPWYGGAAERSYDAARQLADWITELVTANVTSWEKIHIVGFSLGAQVAGITSKFIPYGARIGRLTGLDPARPKFDDKPPEDHLDAEDSDFTTIVHTCGGFLAIPEPLGHVDFYPNGGQSPQPPCSEDLLNNILHKFIDSPTPMIAAADRGPTKLFAGLVCSHYMALALWVESLKPGIKFVAKRCPSWKSYLNKTCDDGLSGTGDIVMGENLPRSTRGTYFFKTEAEVPYSLTLNDLISDGIEEYSKILTVQLPDSDRGHGEVEEVTPEVKVMLGTSPEHSHEKDMEHHDDSINRIDSERSASSPSRRTTNSLYISIFILVITALRLK